VTAINIELSERQALAYNDPAQFLLYGGAKGGGKSWFLCVWIYTNAIQKNTISLTTLQAGVGNPPKANVIPSTSEATLDCRLLPGVSHQEFISEVKARINDPRVSVELISTPDDPGASPHQTPLFTAIAKAIRQLHPDAVVTPMLVPHGTDSVKLRKKGITAYGLTPMILDLATAGTMHSDQERIPIDEFKKGIRIFYEVLKSEI